MNEYVVIAITRSGGSGSVDGRRLWSERFKSKAAASEALAFINKHNTDGRAILVEDSWPRK